MWDLVKESHKKQQLLQELHILRNLKFPLKQGIVLLKQDLLKLVFEESYLKILNAFY